ncbi:MAG: DUF5050 domain-containing protein [Eubacterium sp.]|nr:DUF5050 domain-containing protein [Eubacterium sp.]
MKDNYFDNPNTDENRIERQKKKKKGSFGKTLLMIVGMLIIAFAAFIITIKVISPDFDLVSLVPKQVMSVIKPQQETQTAELTTEKTTVTTTVPSTREALTYLPIEDFATDEAKKGNQLGNILNGGLVGSDLNYVYHIVNGDGIYRFYPATESYSRIYKTADKLCSLNLRGDYLFFVNRRNDKLYRLQKSSQKAEALADNVRQAYVYDSKVFYVTKDNRMCVMSLDSLKEKTLYNSVDETMNIVGVSLKRVFFTIDGISQTKFMTVDIKGKKKAQEFRAPCSKEEVLSPVMENGFLYYFELQENGSYNLCRYKYGAKDAVTLAENISAPSVYPITDKNRVFYATSKKENRLNMVELNMNSGEEKVMLSVSGVGEGNTLTVQHGDSYDFIIGKKSGDGKKVYVASGIYTGSTNVMSFKDGNWSY